MCTRLSTSSSNSSFEPFYSHPNEWSVYNFDKWVMFHPGNVNAYMVDKKNPIAAFAESSENEEDMITIVMPSWHPSSR